MSVYNSYESIIAELTKRRIERGWSQWKLAQEAGIAHTTIGRIEALEYTPMLTTVLRLADALDMTITIEPKEKGEAESNA